ncbi:MAG: efflux RND transporter periplasmic adaptor subunit [Gemmatimonadales bacterium]|jgi:multidrug resistance efflux pump
MLFAFSVITLFTFIFWLVFSKLKLAKFTMGWGVVYALVVLHLLLVFLIGMRFMTPYSTTATMVQPTIQLVPRLTAPTLVTAVLVEPDVVVKKGTPLFQFDRRPYQYQVSQLEAQLAQARQNVRIYQADVEVAAEKVSKARNELTYAEWQQARTQELAGQGAGSEEEAQQWAAQLGIKRAALKEAEAEALRARLKYQSQIDGVNTDVASVQAQLELARYYLDNTTMVAPEDGYIVNLQVRPGMVAGEVRFGAIASFICTSERYLLASYTQENLKYVKVGMPVEVALNLYPGQIFTGKVRSIWKASGDGQYLPSGTLPVFRPLPPEAPQGMYAVRIDMDSTEQSLFPIGAQGTAAIYTGSAAWSVLRRVSIRTHTWLNWLYPFDM